MNTKRNIIIALAVAVGVLLIMWLVYLTVNKHPLPQFFSDIVGHSITQPAANQSGSNQNSSGQNNKPGDSAQKGELPPFADFFSEGGDSSGDGHNGQNGNQDEYAGWKTYINNEIGYKLRYPADWTVKETAEFNETIGQNVKYITVNTPGNKFFLGWGLKKTNDPFYISDRTGVGAGDMKAEGKIKILNTDVTVNRQVWEGKTQEVFFPGPGSQKTSDQKYSFQASFTPRGNDNFKESDIELAKKILRSVELIARHGEICASTLTDADKEFTNQMLTYHSDKYGYSFKYPKTMSPEEIRQGDAVMFLNLEDEMGLQWRSGEMAGIQEAPARWQKVKTEETEIACQRAAIKYYENVNEGQRTLMLIATFTKGATPHLVAFSFDDIGASNTGDMVDYFHTILRTIQFEDQN